MFRYVAIGVGATICASFAVRAMAADRRRTTFHFDAVNRVMHSNWRMEKDTTCAQFVFPDSSRTEFSDWKVLKRPAHGVAGLESATSFAGHHYAYRPRQGFVGRDSFVVAFRVGGKAEYVVTVNVDVDVLPTLQ